MNTFIDQTGYKLQLAERPVRIISLVPSQSELLWDLGLEKEVVGITKFCLHPQKMFETVSRVGGTKTISFEKIKELNPDLIIGNKEENVKEQIELLRKSYNVWMSDVNTLDNDKQMIKSVGVITGKIKEADQMASEIELKFKELKSKAIESAAYLMWHNPYMAAASGTFIDSIMQSAGLYNVYSDKLRYPEINLEELSRRKPDYILLSTEPFPFNEKHVAEMQKSFPQSKVLLVDGEMFSWYGSRLKRIPGYLKNLF